MFVRVGALVDWRARRACVTGAIALFMAFTINRFTCVFGTAFESVELSSVRRIHHPFLLADNRHYTFYVWQRIFRRHAVVPYLFAPGYLVCMWLWFVRAGKASCTPTRCFIHDA